MFSCSFSRGPTFRFCLGLENYVASPARMSHFPVGIRFPISKPDTNIVPAPPSLLDMLGACMWISMKKASWSWWYTHAMPALRGLWVSGQPRPHSKTLSKMKKKKIYEGHFKTSVWCKSWALELQTLSPHLHPPQKKALLFQRRSRLTSKKSSVPSCRSNHCQGSLPLVSPGYYVLK
jgi:hypothetical protein